MDSTNLGRFLLLLKLRNCSSDESHSLAGSILRLFEGVKNVFDWSIVSAEEAIVWLQKTQLALWNW